MALLVIQCSPFPKEYVQVRTSPIKTCALATLARQTGFKGLKTNFVSNCMRTARQKCLNMFLIYLGNVEAQIFFLNVFIEA